MYDLPRNRRFSARAFAGPTKTSEISHRGSTAYAITVKAARGSPREDRVKFLMETPAIRLSLAAFAAHVFTRRGIYLTELHELIVRFAPYFRDKGALVPDVLRPGALPVAATAHLAHKTESLCSAGEATNERGGTFVLSALDFNSCACCHDVRTLAHRGGHCLRHILHMHEIS